MTRMKVVAALAALFVIGDGAIAGAGAVTVWRGASGASNIERAVVSGVSVYRAAKPVESELAGAAPPRVGQSTEIIIVERRRPPKRFMRTQGFYSGHPGDSRRYAQGFWSGPVDLPRSTARFVLIRKN
ncbi:MAG: hypothetical protein HXY23_01930 [Parvularculaceae bacterium]|jgi:hypothetical protein|nr:hypothetical protein [Parvularculaceae bacterium]